MPERSSDHHDGKKTHRCLALISLGVTAPLVSLPIRQRGKQDATLSTPGMEREGRSTKNEGSSLLEMDRSKEFPLGKEDSTMDTPRTTKTLFLT
jgi:hypothetical protein